MKRFNWAVFILMLTALSIGLAFIHSASYKISSGTYDTYALKQVVRIAIGLGIFFFLLFPKYSTLGDYLFIFYLICIVLLIAVFFIGSSVKGSIRWIPLGFFNLQPSELAKIAVILVVAKCFSQMDKSELQYFGSLLKPFLFTAIPMGIIVLQPDLGTALVLVPIFLGIAFVAGAKSKHIMLIILACLLMIPVGYQFLKPYQRGRLLSFINPEKDEYRLAEGYQLIQSKAAIGSGGLLGKGWGEGTQNNYDILPERRTDFIFSVIAEEWGFAGTLFILLVLFGIIFLCMEIAYKSKDMFGRLIAVGVSIFLFLHTVINVGMTIGLMPVTGLTLPFVSYGGSSLFVSFVAVSLAINVGMRPARVL
ncbi:MAG: rod shape-determining protein RodA [Planctomycetota bacterium]